MTMLNPDRHQAGHCHEGETTAACALQALPPEEMTAAEAHIASCPHCLSEFASLRSVVDRFVSWPIDVLRPPESLRARLTSRISQEAGSDTKSGIEQLPLPRWSEPAWEQVAPGIECKLLATDSEKHRVSMLVRLAPGANYPAHVHAGVEELHLLDGELWIGDRHLTPGDYNYAAPGSSDRRVWSETGCTCVLVTSTKDILRQS